MKSSLMEYETVDYIVSLLILYHKYKLSVTTYMVRLGDFVFSTYNVCFVRALKLIVFESVTPILLLFLVKSLPN